MPLHRRLMRDCKGRELVKEQFRIGNPLNGSILHQTRLSGTMSYESISGHHCINVGVRQKERSVLVYLGYCLYQVMLWDEDDDQDVSQCICN